MENERAAARLGPRATVSLRTRCSEVRQAPGASHGHAGHHHLGGVSTARRLNALQRKTGHLGAPRALDRPDGQGGVRPVPTRGNGHGRGGPDGDLGFLPMSGGCSETTPDPRAAEIFPPRSTPTSDRARPPVPKRPGSTRSNEKSSRRDRAPHARRSRPRTGVAVSRRVAGGEETGRCVTRDQARGGRLPASDRRRTRPGTALNLGRGARARHLAASPPDSQGDGPPPTIAARGTHSDGNRLVIHGRPADEHKAYVQRSGRTARGGRRRWS